jgi:endonuclease/exonuclease/phosphatase (EEP) superfamily protein YafD
MPAAPLPATCGPPIASDLPAYGLAAATLAGFAGGWHWLFDLASHYRWYWLLAALLWYAVTSRRRSRLAAACLVVAVVGNGGPLVPYWLPTAGEPGAGDPLTIVSLNLEVGNLRQDLAVGFLRQVNADVVVLLEVSEAWAEAVESLADLYPHRVVEPRTDLFGIAVLSRLPLEAVRFEPLAEGPPVVIAGLPRGERGCLLVAAHPPAPLSAAWSARRDAQLAAIGELAATEVRPVIVAGDLNATPWSHGFRRLTGPRGLRDSALGRGVQGSWHARLWVPRIPIDHVVVSEGVAVVSRSLGPPIGSDHLPVVATLLVP